MELLWDERFQKEYVIRFAHLADAPAVRRLVNAAYQELARQGLNYTASYQDDTVTRERMAEGQTFLLFDGPHLVGTLHLRDKDALGLRRCAYFGQFGIRPDLQGSGLGTRLMDFAENWARQQGYQIAQLDTAKPARRLVEWYQRRGYRIVCDTRFEGKTYESWIFEKGLVEV